MWENISVHEETYIKPLSRNLVSNAFSDFKKFANNLYTFSVIY